MVHCKDDVFLSQIVYDRRHSTPLHGLVSIIVPSVIRNHSGKAKATTSTYSCTESHIDLRVIESGNKHFVVFQDFLTKVANGLSHS